jgi:hypothetical protein
MLEKFDYAKEVEKYRKSVLKDLPYVKIKGELALENGYPFAKGHTGHIVETLNKNGKNVNKIFTGTRIWFIPEEDCEVIPTRNEK